MREKTLGVGAASGFAVGLIISFVTPYIQNAEYGNLGGKIACACPSSWTGRRTRAHGPED